MLIGVTGASGFIGRALVPALLNAGYQVRVLMRTPRSQEELPWHDRVEAINGDLLDSRSLASFCQGCAAVIHLAALAHINGTTPEQHEESSEKGTAMLLNALREARVPKLVYISSIKASDDIGVSAYARSKARAERLVQKNTGHGLKAVILRPAVVYGAGMKGNLATWMRRIQRGWVPRLPAQTAALHMVSKQDLCEAIVGSLFLDGAKGEIYTVTDGRVYPLDRLERVIRVALGKPLPVIAMPRLLWQLAGQAGDLVFRFCGRSTGFTGQSYQTLFVQENPQYPPLPEFEAGETFESQLPAIIGEL